jgi:hypothetical protein
MFCVDAIPLGVADILLKEMSILISCSRVFLKAKPDGNQIFQFVRYVAGTPALFSSYRLILVTLS